MAEGCPAPFMPCPALLTLTYFFVYTIYAYAYGPALTIKYNTGNILDHGWIATPIDIRFPYLSFTPHNSNYNIRFNTSFELNIS